MSNKKAKLPSGTTSAIAGLLLGLGLACVGAEQAGAQPKSPPARNSAGRPAGGFKQIIPHGTLLHKPATQPSSSKRPTSYELGAGFQLDRTHCLLVSNLDEQGGPDLCVGNDARRLDVAVDQAVAVEVFERRGEGEAEADTLVHRQATAREQFAAERPGGIAGR